MKIYSETSFSFILKAEKWLKDIIESETAITVRRTRFEFNRHLYPIEIVIISKSKTLGYFDPTQYQIALNEHLIFHATDEVIKNILRHEFAHYMQYLKYPNSSLAHGPEFKEICKTYNWGAEVSSAYMNLDIENIKTINQNNGKIIAKVQALLKLAESDNAHEAQMATIRANQLILKHNLEQTQMDDDVLYIEAVYKAKRRNQKMHVFYEILKDFLVKPVFVYASGEVKLEVSGKLDNIELAHYIIEYLDKELERLWKKSGLKGLKAKNSFFTGMIKGYQERMKEHHTTHPLEKKALVKIQNEIDLKMNRYYRRLSHTSSQRSHDHNAYSQGEKQGRSLNVRSPLNHKTKLKQLIWRKS